MGLSIITAETAAAFQADYEVDSVGGHGRCRLWVAVRMCRIDGVLMDVCWD